jgi:trehalose 2-sulfotransferase
MLPLFTPDTAPKTLADRWKFVTRPPPDTTYDKATDAALIRWLLEYGTTENGVFGVVIHWVVLEDAVRRLRAFLDTDEAAPHRVFSAAFPNLSCIWLRRRDKVAQAVSWYRAIQTGNYAGKNGKRSADADEHLRFDYGRIRYLLTVLTSFENAQGLYFSSNGLTPLVLYYEDLSSQYVSTIRSALDFLQLDADSVEIDPPKREKYADALSLAWIEQFKLLHNQARSTRR